MIGISEVIEGLEEEFNCASFSGEDHRHTAFQGAVGSSLGCGCLRGCCCCCRCWSASTGASCSSSASTTSCTTSASTTTSTTSASTTTSTTSASTTTSTTSAST